MKNLLLTVLLLAAVSASFGQVDVPTSVLLTFEELHPTVYDPLWEEREGALVATFTDDAGLKKVFFSPQGSWLETRMRIGRASLPAGVAAFIEKNYSQADITFLARVLRGGSPIYRVESEIPGEVVVKELDESGKLLTEERITFDALLAPESNPAPLPASAAGDLEQ